MVVFGEGVQTDETQLAMEIVVAVNATENEYYTHGVTHSENLC